MPFRIVFFLMWLWCKRLLTAGVLFCLLFVLVFVGSLMVGGGIYATVKSPPVSSNVRDFRSGFDEGYDKGRRAGAEFGLQYGRMIRFGSLAVAVVGALGFSFGGVLPWCRAEVPPPLPLDRFHPR